MFMWAMSDRGIPRSYRMMQGFGVNTYSLLNKEGKRNFVKFHWIPHLGVHSLVWDEALKLGGQDPDYHRKDLMEAIANKAYPKWDFAIQVIAEEDQDNFEFDIMDATKIWPEELVPMQVIGELELNRNVDEFFTQTEQVAFCTSHIVPGVDFSDDPLLQGRNFSYFDTQISRLGINWEELPINRPVCPFMNFNRDGAMRHRISKGSVNYWPNRFEANPPAEPGQNGFVSHPQTVVGTKKRHLSPKFKEHHNQAQLFYNSLSEIEKVHVRKAFCFELDHCDDPIVYERLAGTRLAELDLPLAQAVAEMVGAPIPQKALRPNHGKKSVRLSQLDFVPKAPSIVSRRIAIIIGDGYDKVAYNGMKAAALAAQALPFTIGLKRSPIYADGESKDSSNGVIPDHQYDGQRSTMFDATFIPGGSHIKTLKPNGQLRYWISESFGHLKAIGATGEAVQLVKDVLGTAVDVQVAGSDSPVEWYGVVTASGPQKPESFSEGARIVKDAGDFAGKFFYQISQHRNWQRELDGLAASVAV